MADRSVCCSEPAALETVSPGLAAAVQGIPQVVQPETRSTGILRDRNPALGRVGPRRVCLQGLTVAWLAVHRARGAS